MRLRQELEPPEDETGILFTVLPGSPGGASGLPTDGESVARAPSRRLREREIALGLVFSLSFHALLAAAALCALLFRPFHAPSPSFLTVSLVGLGGSGGGNGEAGEAEGAPPASEQSAASLDTEPEAAPVAQVETPPVTRPERIVPQHSRVKAVKRKRIVHPWRQTDHKAPAFSEPGVELAQSPAGESHGESTGTGGAGLMPGGGGPAGPGSGAGTGGAGPAGGVPGELDMKQVDTPPTPIHKVEPDYPQMAKKMGISGRVVLKFLVRTDGSTGKASVVESNPPGVFDRSALDAVEKWRFKPGRFRGSVVATWVVLPVQFRLAR